MIGIVDDCVDARDLLKDGESDSHDQWMSPFPVKYLAPWGGFVLLAESDLNFVQVRLDIAARVDSVGFRTRLVTPILHHQPARGFRGQYSRDVQREPGDGCRPEHHPPIAASRTDAH